MKKKKLTLIILCGILLFGFGCLGEGKENKSKVNITNETKKENESKGIGMGLDLEEQQKQTIKDKIKKGNKEERENKGFTYNPNATTRIYFVDVSNQGQHGDAIVIKKGDLDILIDAGPKDNAHKVVDLMRTEGVDDIDLFISTTVHENHYSGISEINEWFKIEEVWWTGKNFNDKNYEKTINKLKKNSETKIVRKGFNKSLNGINLRIWNPGKRFDSGNHSILTEIKDKKTSLILFSRLKGKTARKIVRETNIQGDVVQVPYYGLPTGVHDLIKVTIIKNTKPEAVIATGGKTEDDDMRKPLIDFINNKNIDMYTNSNKGTIEIRIDETGYKIKEVN